MCKYIFCINIYFNDNIKYHSFDKKINANIEDDKTGIL